MPAPPDDQGQRQRSSTPAQDQSRGHDRPGAGDRPVTGSPADLLRRLDGLPHGHPSSPYHDDGTSKPTLIRLKDLELPLPAGGAQPAAVGPPVAAQVAVTQPAAAQVARSQLAAAEKDADELAPVADAFRGGSFPADPFGGELPSADAFPADVPLADFGTGDIAADLSAAEAPVAPEPDPVGPLSLRAEPDEDPVPASASLTGAASNGLSGLGEPARPAEAARPGEPAEPEESAEPGETLTPEQVRIAVRAHGRCRLAEGRSVFGSYGEGGLTPAMRRIEDQLADGDLVPETEKYALKSLDRFQQKLAKLIAEEPAASPDSLAAQIHDGIRYTFLYEPSGYTRGVQDTRSTLVAHGYELQMLRNSWDSEECQGVSSRWRDPVSGTHFEIQFHTGDSWAAWQQAHDGYDQIVSPLTPASRKEQLRLRQRDIYSAVQAPAGCGSIAGYRREG